MATSVLGLKTFAASDPVDYNEINDNYNKIDSGVKTALQGRAVHNWLDNSDFRNPVNQRGATTATLGEYFIDRWETEAFPSGPSITIDSNGLTLLPTTSSTAGIYQNLPDYEKRKGKVHTLAICVGDVWKCGSFEMGKQVSGVLIHGMEIYSIDAMQILMRHKNTNNPVPITIQRMALYEGSYTADTLPAYQPKGYAAELAECQRYYREVYRVFGKDVGNVTREAIVLNPPMRIPPTSTVKSLWKGNDDTSVTVSSTANNNADVTYTGWGSATIAFSADL